MNKRNTILAAATAAVLTAAVAPALLANAEPDAGPNALTWSSCLVLFQCAKTEVPLDHADPAGKKITISMIKAPAADQSRKIGPLFLNPGGPGITMTDGIYFAGIVNALGPAVRDRFDIIGIDPRGTGQSTPFGCTAAPGVPPAEAVSNWPDPPQYQQKFAHDEYLRASCAATAPEITYHLSTADTARDLDLVREALGEQKISYFGTSYGSYLGATYAALFPTRVRAMALDGVVDPTMYAEGKLSAKWSEASAEAVYSGFERCDQVGFFRCPLAGDARGRWERVVDSLYREPLALPGMTLDGKTFQGLTQNAMSMDRLAGVPVSTFSVLVAFTKGVDLLRFGPLSVRGNGLLDQLGGQLRQLLDATKEEEKVAVDAARAIQCVDSPWPADQQSWIDSAEQAEAAYPRFGAMGAWSVSLCANWPGSGKSSYRGPFDLKLDTPPLLSNPTHDANTGISGARGAQRQFAGSRLVEVETWGHTALGKSANCLTPITNAYLIDLKPPERDVRCRPDHALFG
ncbi:TAP-like protein [Herbihabitans rhizosphaerae]|uniref:TAP-like protein n=1 Tax=Herbihabitans rhizosphaerae TaxID=1872711 RepID=A0A4Q7KKR7_9PSEU|nr:alpha/beta fold hydrolase [Herbihabitans rhizosphaerae]RZS36480.1 TAP-like protein [Herbihabitans rhizosphaerae]